MVECVKGALAMVCGKYDPAIRYMKDRVIGSTMVRLNQFEISLPSPPQSVYLSLPSLSHIDEHTRSGYLNSFAFFHVNGFSQFQLRS